MARAARCSAGSECISLGATMPSALALTSTMRLSPAQPTMVPSTTSPRWICSKAGPSDSRSSAMVGLEAVSVGRGF